jgi:hypothetical protein
VNYGQVGSNFTVQSTSDPFQVNNWQFLEQVTMTNLSQVLQTPISNSSNLFFRSLRP